MISVTEEQINHSGSGLIKAISARQNNFDSVHAPSEATSRSLVFVSSLEQLLEAKSHQALGFIVLEKKISEFQNLIPHEASLWSAASIQQAMSVILQLFDRKALSWPHGVHPTAVIDPTAQVAATAEIGPYTVIQKSAVVHDHVKLGSHVVIESGAEIGSGTSIASHVVVGAFCKIGQRCLIASHTTIGSDGFGYYSDRKGHHKIPQIGIVVIENDCEIGASCTIDRATLEQTRIRQGSKLDNHCHIAHNVEIGENSILAAGFKTAGSVKFGKNLIAGGNVDINGHIEICDNVTLAGRTGVVGSIKEPGIYAGFPEELHKNNIKTMASLPHLNKIRKQVQKIMKHLQLEE